MEIIRYKSGMDVDALLNRGTTDRTDVEKTVADIIENVRSNGDRALKEYALKFDGCEIDNLAVTDEELNKAYNETDKEFIAVLEQAAENIRQFHSLQKREGFTFKKENGIILGQKIIPIEKVGLYVPGGTASYPSSVLMNAIPAVIAGVSEIVMVTPPDKEGNIRSDILAAAKVAGVNKIIKSGGAQSIAALAYGTESVPKVDKIVGPGNIFVATAKRQVFGKVNIDMIAGPSEILVVAEPTANPKYVAADLLSQAEHDKLAAAVLITTDEAFAKRVSDEVDRQVKLLPRYEIASSSIENYGKAFIVDSLDEAVELANEVAPEHLELAVDNPFDLLERVKNAGSIFLGKNVPEALGDYFAGPNHTLPTGKTARFSSPLSVDDYIKKSQFIYYPEAELEKAKDSIAFFAEREGLSGHARSVTTRFEEE
ncbi:MAG: histidinol dehydrogenase [Ruminococcaceae bacterium]|nr:histidinol dehydrogenase [Oscillospiraceae bacterium]